MFKQTLFAQDIKIIDKEVLHEGFCRVERYTLIQKRFDGGWSQPFTREFIAKPVAVGALPYDPRTKQLVLIEQFRIGAVRNSITPWLIEIVAGIKDQEHAESDEEIVRREMREEAGLEVEALMEICDYFTTPGCTTEKIKLFCAKVDATKAPQFSGLKEENEDIKVHVVSTQEAFAAVRSGKINNGSAIISLQWLELNLREVNKLWQKVGG